MSGLVGRLNERPLESRPAAFYFAQFRRIRSVKPRPWGSGFVPLRNVGALIAVRMAKNPAEPLAAAGVECLGAPNGAMQAESLPELKRQPKLDFR